MEDIKNHELNPGLETFQYLFDWDFQESSCKNIDELSKLEISQAIEAFRYLKKTLGAGFPLQCMQRGHPLNIYFWNRAPWTRAWFTWLATCLRELQGADHFKEVLDKLCSTDLVHVREAVSLLETAYRFQKVGWTVQFCEVVTNSTNQRKVPDMAITNIQTSEKIVVEVSRLSSDEEMDKYGGLSWRVIRAGMHCAGRLLKRMSREHWEEIVQEVDRKVLFSREHHCFQEINHPGVLEFVIDHPGSLVLAEWCQERGVSLNAFVLPPIIPFDRIKGKIIQKAKQMSHDHFSIVVIHHEDYSHLFLSLEETVAQIEETIFKFQDLAAVVITGWEFGPTDKVIISQGLNCLVQRTERHAVSSRTLMVFNKFNKKSPITLHSLQKLMDAMC